MPNERYIFLKLTYNEGTPQDYEPPLFRAATEDDFGAFPHPPCELVTSRSGSYVRSSRVLSRLLRPACLLHGANLSRALGDVQAWLQDVGLMDTSFFRSTLRIKTVLADGQQVRAAVPAHRKAPHLAAACTCLNLGCHCQPATLTSTFLMLRSPGDPTPGRPAQCRSSRSAAAARTRADRELRQLQHRQTPQRLLIG